MKARSEYEMETIAAFVNELIHSAKARTESLELSLRAANITIDELEEARDSALDELERVRAERDLLHNEVNRLTDARATIEAV